MMPPAIQRPRPAIASVATSTMPTISPASRTSRKTIRAAASMASVSGFGRGHPALGGLRVELAHEAVGPGLQRADGERHLAFGRDQFLDLQVVAVELLGGHVLVGTGDA